MNFPLIVATCLVLAVYQVSGETNKYEYAVQRPWSAFAYAVYPFYNSEALLEVWKADKAIDISSNIVALSPNDQGQGQISLLTEINRRNETGQKTENDVQYLGNEAAGATLDQLSKSRQRLSSYRNRFKAGDIQNE